MSVKTFNPYFHLEKFFSKGMNSIIDNLPPPPPTPTTETFFNAIVEGISSMFDNEDEDNNGLVEIIASPIIPNAVNAYRDNNLPNELYYNEMQRMLVASILMAIKNSPPESIEELLNDAEDKVSEAGLSSSEQAPLFMAIALGKASYAYWRSVIGECNPPPGPPVPPGFSSSSSSSLAKWLPYLDCNRAINYANLPFWVCATMESAMLGYSQVNSFNFRIPGVLNALGVTGGTLTAAFASLGVSAGKVIYKWVPRVKINVDIPSVSRSIVNDFDNDPYAYIQASRRAVRFCAFWRSENPARICAQITTWFD